ncbi:AbgT family transporter [bacterium]|nr:AbgT family transporter [bacterium]
MLERFFQWVERTGNRLPHPLWLFIYIIVGVLFISLLAGLFKLSAINPKNGEEVVAVNILSADGLRYFVMNMVSNFSHFAPLGLVVVMIMGVSIAENTGFLESLIKTAIQKVPSGLVIPVIIIAGACGNVGSDAGIVVVPPIAALIFKRMGKHPLAGLVLGYAAATAGFTANLLPAGTDVLLSAISTEALQSVNPGGAVPVTANYYFMIVSTFMLAIVGTYVVKKYTLKEVGPMPQDDTNIGTDQVSSKEKKALKWACIAGLIYVLVLLMTIIPENGILRHPDPNLFTRSPFFRGLIPILFFWFAIMGYVYGKISGSISKSADLANAMTKGVVSIAPFIVLTFAIAEFIELFQYSRLDQIIAIYGAILLSHMHLPTTILLTLFILMSLFVNLFIGSGSAKWAMFAPVFIPMFYHIGISADQAQLAYRIGDSITNGVSPCYTMFPLIIGWVMQYKKDAGIGTVFSLLLPYTLFFGVAWIIMYIFWSLLGLPIGL